MIVREGGIWGRGSGELGSRPLDERRVRVDCLGIFARALAKIESLLRI